ncbi:hypothetical protein BDC45DRAFT_506589 [Circinella umbellata]|nr:hypothetical protein BDC45DRAFT_506589 [Circinella umbellata]
MANHHNSESVMASQENDTTITTSTKRESMDFMKKDQITVNNNNNNNSNNSNNTKKRTNDLITDPMDLDIQDENGHLHQQKQQRTESPAKTLPTMHEAQRRTKRSGNRSAVQPRWHNQAYMLFLALRQHPDRCLSRPELIRAALALDEKISKERNLPRVFKGKTPMNSASASLTTNTDRYFIPFRPDGSRSMHFKLAYEPGNFKIAVQEYTKWEKKLAEHDWPFCFGIPKNPSLLSTNANGKEKEQQQQQQRYKKPALPQLTEFDEFMMSRNGKNGCHVPQSYYDNDDNNNNTKDDHSDKNNNVITTTGGTTHSDINIGYGNGNVIGNDLKMDVDKTNGEDGSNTAAIKAVNELEQQEETKLDDLDLSDVPKTWRDILYVGDSSIQGAGQGLFAKRKLPYNSPLGFYFGVPMTEDEYDSLKDGVGRASEYSIMYRRTVLDATDEHGQPFIDPEGEMFCPFHFMNETNEQQANILFIEGAVVNQVICWTKRDIEPGEELFVWYGRDVDRHWTPTTTATSPSSLLSPSVSNNSNRTAQTNEINEKKTSSPQITFSTSPS